MGTVDGEGEERERGDRTGEHPEATEGTRAGGREYEEAIGDRGTGGDDGQRG